MRTIFRTIFLLAGFGCLLGCRGPAADHYLRMGITPMEMVPSEEFDALFYIDRVGPPSYAIP